MTIAYIEYAGERYEVGDVCNNKEDLLRLEDKLWEVVTTSPLHWACSFDRGLTEEGHPYFVITDPDSIERCPVYVEEQ